MSGVIVVGSINVDLIARVTERPGPVGFSGIDQRSAEIGAAAAAQLHGMIQRGEKGRPTVPAVMMIKGHWVEAGRRRTVS